MKLRTMNDETSYDNDDDTLAATMTRVNTDLTDLTDLRDVFIYGWHDMILIFEI